MALSGIQIYKLLPQTNCKECGFPTCLAFAMKLAAKQVDLSSCPYVSESSKSQLAESSAPPIRLVSIKSNGYEIKAGNEVVLYRHDKTFYNCPGLFIRIKDTETVDAISAKVSQADTYKVSYVGMDLAIDGFAVEAASGDPGKFSSIVQLVRTISKRPLMLITSDSTIAEAGLKLLGGEFPLLCGATTTNWEGLTELAKKYQAALVVKGSSLDEIVDLTDKIKAKGVENLVIEPIASGQYKQLALNTQIRRLALKNNRKLGFPTLTMVCNAGDPDLELNHAVQAITKYTGFVVLSDFKPEAIYPLLVLRQNIYTDPQKPIQVTPGLYEINSPKPEDPVLVTTNFSITYFSVANEVESSGLPAWLLVADAEGMSVLTAWAAGKFDAERIAKAVKTFNVAEKISRKRIIIPGHVAVLSGDLEEDLPGWEIRVGPREAVDIPSYMKKALGN
jgi:acetyl-CoA decarbonylase/synthase, CODH/ACS complex subunit gamma